MSLYEWHLLIKSPILIRPIITILIFMILSTLPSAHCDDHHEFAECSRPYDCGLIKNISYPFWSASMNRPQHCGRGGYELIDCQEVKQPLIKIQQQHFLVLNISHFHIITLARSDLYETSCTNNFVNTTLDYDRFAYVQTVRNLTLYYGCVPQDESIPNNFTCKMDGTDSDVAYFADDWLSRLPHPNRSSCQTDIRVPILWPSFAVMSAESATAQVLQQVLRAGFQVEYKAEWEMCRSCMASNGTCGSNSTSDSFLCFCGDGPHHLTCPTLNGNKWLWQIGVGFCYAVSMCFIFFVYQRRNRKKYAPSFIYPDQDLEDFIPNDGPLAGKRYKFSDIREMTNSFNDKVGQGGCGDVYKGRLLDGRPVAVKVLKASKGNGQDLVNEVATISRTSHVNVVTLLGYCFEGQKRALIYEFMSNGSLEKFICKNNPLKTTPLLELEKLFEIACGIARGLDYLHRGCNTRILHFDIKPHNILLDENFCPKISDFGLSKLFLRKESIISMSDARGTIGYIAPEVFCRNFGAVSVKSDVYSYGMMILEMVGGRKNNDVRMSHTSDIYFPDFVYKRLEQGSNLGFPNPMTEEENELARKMIIVGLWCIQTKPSDRPSMSKAIEMLEGSIEALRIPPKPVLSSPVRSPAESSTISILS